MWRTAIVVGLAAIVALLGAPAYAGSVDHKHTCGIVTCSDYYSHSATVQFDDALQQANTGPGAGANLGILAVCKTVGVKVPFVDILCDPLAAGGLTIDAVKDVIHHAATSNGCMRFVSPRGADGIYVEVRADHSSTCHSMD